METRAPNLALLAQVLDAAALRHRVIAQNIANVNTPGYHRREVAFEADLARALAASESPANVKPHVVVVDDGPERVDGNNVDIDNEMSALTKNSLLYQAAVQLITSRISSQRAAIAGR
jgi:flagellar basal-body rod protein FlgB